MAGSFDTQGSLWYDQRRCGAGSIRWIAHRDRFEAKYRAHGDVAQRLEQAAHNRWVGSSNLPVATFAGGMPPAPLPPYRATSYVSAAGHQAVVAALAPIGISTPFSSAHPRAASGRPFGESTTGPFAPGSWLHRTDAGVAV